MSEVKPNIDKLKHGLMVCPSCSHEFQIDAYEALDVTHCSECQTPVFIPLNVKSFWLYQPLGGGGMGSVYKAVSEEESGEFAVKVLPRKKKHDQMLINTLLMEGEIGKTLGKHPHIIEVVDYGCDGDEYFMVSRFLEGTRLDIFVSSASLLSEKQALEILDQVLDAEIHITNCGYLFRDMKPENIMLVEKTGVVKLFDFGLCMPVEKAANPDPNDPLEGSPFYLPPERIVAAPEGEYSEIYSLGMLLFYMLTGTTYFSQADVKDLVSKHVRSLRVASVASRLKNSSQEIIDLVDKMIQKDPNQRYHKLSEVSEIVKKLKDKASGYSLAGGQRAREQKEKESKHKKSLLPTIISGSVVLLVLVGGFFGWRVWNSIQYEKKKAEVIKRTALALSIDPDVKMPALSVDEIESLIDKKVKEKLAEKESELPPFDEKKALAEICRELSISTATRKKTPFSVNKVKQLARKELDTRIKSALKKGMPDFNEEATRKRIAKAYNIEYPFVPVTATPAEIKKEAQKEASRMADEKFPKKALAQTTMAILKKFKCYKIGDRVAVPTISGETLKGVYQGHNGRKIRIDAKEIPTADLPKDIAIKFNPPLASKIAGDAVKRAKAEFDRKKLAYKKSVYSTVLNRLYRANGYFKSKGKWCSAAEIVNAKVRESRLSYEKKKLAEDDKIIKSVKNAFDKEKFFATYGYRRVGDHWISETELVNRKLKRRLETFNADKNKKLKAMEPQLRDNIALDIYKSNGYIYREGKWLPAKVVLDEEIKKALRRIR